MDGSATFTIVVSSSAMNAPASTIETARQPCPAGAALALELAPGVGLARPGPALVVTSPP